MVAGWQGEEVAQIVGCKKTIVPAGPSVPSRRPGSRRDLSQQWAREEGDDDV